METLNIRIQRILSFHYLLIHIALQSHGDDVISRRSNLKQAFVLWLQNLGQKTHDDPSAHRLHLHPEISATSHIFTDY